MTRIYFSQIHTIYIFLYLSIIFFVTLYLSAFKTLFSIHIKTDLYLWYTHPAWCLSYQTDCLVITQLMMTLLSFASQHFLGFVYFCHFDQIRNIYFHENVFGYYKAALNEVLINEISFNLIWYTLQFYVFRKAVIQKLHTYLLTEYILSKDQVVYRYIDLNLLWK